jgi:hypothetical protein
VAVTNGGRRAGLLCALLLASLAGAPATRAAAARIPCKELDAGPALSARPIVVCVGYEKGLPVVRTSADRGRTWTAKQASGTPEGVDHLVGVLVSPAYDTDRTIYLQYQSLGLFSSTDGGATFVAADPQASTQADQRVAAIDGFGPSIAGDAAASAVAQPDARAVLYRGSHLPVAGSGNRQELRFVQFGHGDGSVVLNASHGPDTNFVWPVRLARCTTELACIGGQTLPAGLTLTELAVDPAKAARTAAVLLRGNDTRPVLWASTDQGRTFVRNASFDKALAKLLKATEATPFANAVTVLPGGKVWLVQFGSSRADYLMVTTDAGRTWTRRPRASAGSRLLTTPEGRVFAGGWFFRCSLDQGRTWADRCPR